MALVLTETSLLRQYDISPEASVRSGLYCTSAVPGAVINMADVGWIGYFPTQMMKLV